MDVHDDGKWRVGSERTMKTRPPARRDILLLGSGVIATSIAASRSVTASQRIAAVTPNRLTSIMPAAVNEVNQMSKHEVRPGVVIAHDEEWFGPPWTTGEPIVLLHGVGESHVSWQQWVPVLSAEYRVIRPDLPGFGQSPLPADYDCSTVQVAGDIVRLLDQLKIDRFHLVGAKYGGSIALQLAADFPQRVRTLAVFGTPSKTKTGGKADLAAFADRIRKDGLRKWAEETQPSRLGSEAPAEMLRWWTDELMVKARAESTIAYTAAAANLNVEPVLNKIIAPTLVVTTGSSPLQPVSAARAWQEMIPKSKLLVVPGDSYPIAAVRPRECANETLRFIATA
jgi:pimeloyl-ACP methyl ester carboxylesterase